LKSCWTECGVSVLETCYLQHSIAPLFSIDHERGSVIHHLELRWAVYYDDKDRLILIYTYEKERERQAIVIR